MTPVVRLRDAGYARGGIVVVAPTTLEVAPGSRVARLCPTASAAKALALMAAGLLRATTGSVSIGEYDPAVQSVHCKRIAAFVAHDPLPMSSAAFDRYVEYRAALWSIDRIRAHAHAKLLMERLDGLHEAFAYPIVAALLASPQVLVLDRPQHAYVRAILEAAPCAVFSTHVDARSLEAYRDPVREEVLV